MYGRDLVIFCRFVVIFLELLLLERAVVASRVIEIGNVT